MILASGTRLGPYEILGQIGAGGMGEVYRARDTRLGREVAIKVLPAAVSSDPERLKRFEKEARSASALNHPNIVTIHDIGESAGTSFIAMEMVEGQTLREVLEEGAVSAKRLLAIAAQVTGGLAKAHGAGIVHRDLKPENVMVTRDGLVKILDFGVAKLTQPEDPSRATHAPTVSGATEPGMVMGTIGYMSPEQATGKALDFRSDQFSFGSIAYELATGKRAFARASAVETMTAIIREEPEPIGSLAPLTPTPLRWIVERCLSKNPDDRYVSTRDLARDLATVRDRMGETSAGVAAVEPPARPGWRRALPWLLAVGLAVALVFRLARPQPNSTAGAPAVRFSVVLPDGVDFKYGEIEGQSSLSPDGRKLVFVGGAAGQRRLYLRSLDSLATSPLEGTEGAVSPFWSPDSRSIGFFADGKLQRKEASGGPPQPICEAPFLETLPSWGSAGQILFAQIGPEKPGIYVASAGGGQPRRLIYSGGSENFGIWPNFLPDGRRFLYVTRDFDKGEDRRWYLRWGSLDSTKTTAITDAIASRIEYVHPGYLVFGRRGALLAQPFDIKSLRLTGDPVTLAEHVYYFNGPAMTGFSASQAGVVSYEKLAPPSRVAWLDRSGRELETIGLDGIVASARLSPDGRMVAAAVRDEKLGTSDLWLYDLSRRLASRLTLDEGDEQAPVWSADGKKIFFRSDRAGPPDLFEIPVTSPGQETVLLRRAGVQNPEDASPDGRSLCFSEWSRRTNPDIWLLPLSGKSEPVPLARTPLYEAGARFSPDGRWIAYVSNESGAREIYLRPVDGGGERIRVSSGGGDMVRWRRDGKELFYLSGKGEIMAIPLGPGARPDPGAPSPLFRLEGEVRDYDVAADGQRFLVDTAPAEPAPISVLINWQALLPTENVR
jgi:Tol biopolymer transport system component/predicted Ser/Thr protein kinase